MTEYVPVMMSDLDGPLDITKCSLHKEQWVRPVNLDQSIVDAQIRENLKRHLPRLQPVPATSDPGSDDPAAVLSICGAGKSLETSYVELQGKVMAMNAAIPFIVSKGIPIDYAMIWDANERMLTYVCDATGATWLVASRVNPKVIDRLLDLGQTVVLWHALGDPDLADILIAAGEVKPDPEYSILHPAMVWGGANGITRMPYLATRLGFHNLNIHGADSSFEGDITKDTHIGGALVNEREILVQVDRSIYRTTPWMAAQVHDWQNDVYPALKAAGVRVTVHGQGLLPHVHSLISQEG